MEEVDNRKTIGKVEAYDIQVLSCIVEWLGMIEEQKEL
jgi:hypothetical protein